jgi:parallel beta-helix repeat protein
MMTMKGRIGKLFEEENSGLITDEKGENRYFHFEQVKGSQPERVDVIVDFIPSKNDEQGLIATQITLLESLLGRVTILNDRGFGFITDQHSGKRWFHFNDVKNSEKPDSIEVNDRVLFTPSKNDRGLVAENVFLLDIHPVQDDKQISSKEENEPPLSAWDSVHPPVEVEKSPNSVAQSEDENHIPLAEWDSAHPPVEYEKPASSAAQSKNEDEPPLSEPDSTHPPVVEETSQRVVQAEPKKHFVEEAEKTAFSAEQSRNEPPLSKPDLPPSPIVEETSQPVQPRQEEHLSQSGWGSLEPDGGEEPVQPAASKPKPKPKNAETQQEVKKGPASESRIYHKDEEHLNITDPIMIRYPKEKNGLLLENCHHVTIENVQVLKSELACLRIINCHHVTIKNCIFDGSKKGQGIQLINSFDIQLENVTCRNHANTGIDIQQGSRNISIISSTVLDNVKAALRIIDSHNVTLNNGTFAGSSKGPGIQLTNAFAIQLENVACGKNASVGIEIEKGSYGISITSSKLLDNAEAGLRMVDGRNVIGRWLKLNKTQKGDGIWLKEVQQIKFEDCHFDNNQLSGIYLDSCSEAVFASSTFSENRTRNGIYLKEVENVQFQHCKFNDNEGYALNTVKSENISVLNPQMHFNKGNYGNITEKSSVEIMDCDLRGKGQFILRGRSTLKTNLGERSRITSMFKGSIFEVDADSELTIIK